MFRRLLRPAAAPGAHLVSGSGGSVLRLVEPYPSAKASKTSLTLQQITKGLPAVLHLFTG